MLGGDPSRSVGAVVSTETRHYEIQRLIAGEWVSMDCWSFPTLEQARRERARIHERGPNSPAFPYRVVAVERRVIWMETEWDTTPAVKEYGDE